ncbi:MAG TPA: Calx-beta domain-containing protein, partial [Vicinamibacteria bacterium]
RIQYRGPTAVAAGAPLSGPAPLTVSFDGSASSDPDGETLTFAWDLDGDGAFDDGASNVASFTYGASGTYVARLRVTDGSGLVDTASLSVSVGNGPPTAAIASPLPSLLWSVGQTLSFAGSASDPDQGSLPASALTWSLVVMHCPADCHEHVVQQVAGVASGSFVAPDHDYPSHLELRLLATDAAGATDTKKVVLQPRTVLLTFDTSPGAFELAVGPSAGAAPLTREVIVGSNQSVSAPAPQARNGVDYGFDSWSDGLAQSHNVKAPATPATYRAVFHPTPPPALTVSDATAGEGNPGSTAALTFTVTLSAPSGKEVSVEYATADGTAKGGSDFLAASGSLVFAPGEVQHSVSVVGLGDALDEADETLSLVLSSPMSAVLADGVGLGVLQDDDASPSLRVADASLVEGAAGTSSMMLFVVSLDAPSGQEVSVAYAAAGATAAPGADFLPASGSLVFAPGEVQRSVAVVVLGDALDEADETLSLVLSSPTGAVLDDGVGLGLIRDDDAPPALRVADASLVEGAPGLSPMLFVVTLDAPSGKPVSVTFATSPQSARPGTDYVTASGSVTLPAGTVNATVAVQVVGDRKPERPELFSLALSNAVGATIADGRAVGQIVDDDRLSSR